VRVTVRAIAVVLICSLLALLDLTDRPGVRITSYLVRDHFIVLERPKICATFIAGFSISPRELDITDCSVEGQLFHNSRLISTCSIRHLDGPNQNLGFELCSPEGDISFDQKWSIPDGAYSISIALFDKGGAPLAKCVKNLNRNQLGRTFIGNDRIHEPVRYVSLDDKKDLPAGSSVSQGGDLKENGWQVFQRSPLERVYPNEGPRHGELLKEIATRAARGEYQSLTFSIRADRNLGVVRIETTPLYGDKGVPAAEPLKIGIVGQLSEVVDESDNVCFYRNAPRIIEAGDAAIPAGYTQSYWLTLKVGAEARPGRYHGAISIRPESAEPMEIPVALEVLPLRFTDTDIQYGMMMTYVSYELDSPIWTEGEKNLIKQRAFETYQDLRDHGMTVVYPHSHFYYESDTAGGPVLQSLAADLEAYKRIGFPGPFCWYMGHLLQTAKPWHPGSITGYDPGVARRRLIDLLDRLGARAESIGIEKNRLLVQIADEPNDGGRARAAAAKELHGIVGKKGFRTLVTDAWPDVDTICTGTPKSPDEAMKLKHAGKQWWIYPNEALTGRNLAYTRYVFGFGAWKWGVNGVVPWTFQMTQGCGGNPFNVLDGSEVMVAYPAVNGVISTPVWETIREGINDYKYIYLLTKMISEAKAQGNANAESLEKRLEALRHEPGKAPQPMEGEFGDWTPESFAGKRNMIIKWALEAQQALSVHSGRLLP
jgi:hypothetical protein